MAETFELDPRLEDSSVAVADWPLCHVRLKDDARFHWLLLIPRRAGTVELTDLDEADYGQLCAEMLAATRLVRELARPDKTNVATLGNVVAQMHVHVIAPLPQRSRLAGPGLVPRRRPDLSAARAGDAGRALRQGRAPSFPDPLTLVDAAAAATSRSLIVPGEQS